MIYNHPLLVMEDFVDESLLVFIREELDMAYLADKLKVLMDGKSKSDDLLFLILSECDYYTDQEQSRFRQTVAGLRKLHPAQYAKARADDLFHKKAVRQGGPTLRAAFGISQRQGGGRRFSGRNLP